MLSTTMSKESGKVFQDTIHGSMQIHELLVKIIDTPEFQRLRHISQVSMTYMVFPGASHRRFEHCMGVCHLSGLMLEALRRNSPAEMEEVTKEDELCVLIAALLHDLGHGPFSHTWEVFVNYAGKEFKHEDISRKMFVHMLDADGGKLRQEFKDNNLDTAEIELILDLIDGWSDKKESLLPEKKMFLYEIVANKTTDIDTDKWDYFLRDGQSFGLKVTFDYQRLLKFTKVIQEKGKYVIAFRDKEKISIEDMFRMRADLHVRAYQHHAAKKIEAMLLDALLAADEHFECSFGEYSKKLSEAHENLEVFLHLTDGIIQSIQGSAKPELKEAKEILERIDRRRLYTEVMTHTIADKGLGELSPKPFNREQVKVLMRIRKEILDEFGVHIIPSQTLITSGKFRKPIENVKFYKKKSPTTDSRIAPETSVNLPRNQLTFFCREEIGTGTKKRLYDRILNKIGRESF